ncbi:DUF3618 domain-containing protein [Streptomyces sp. NPDC006632]|uniref:DUF3618 domain-containing protein n=1 Tax=unclassified Streptomyces TaxID=2593676 RepID=UPI002E1C83A8
MTSPSHDDRSAPGSEELREQVERTREDLGRTVEALAAKADVKGRALEKAAEVQQRAAAKAGELKARTADVAHQVQDKVQDTIQDKVPAPAGRAVRDHRTVLLAAAGAAVVVWLTYRHRKG